MTALEKLANTKVTVRLEDLMLLCLNVDYILDGDDEWMKDAAEDVSIALQKKFKFDSNNYRIALRKIK